ncbi:MAG: RNA polymerase sigma factor [Planctomycetota bacterium]|nr:RNA polymerase sigma factor [Planctomycetota bacterium]
MDEKADLQPLDQTLILASQGDAKAWRRIVELYSGRLYALLVHQCGDRELAEEITQATFVKVVTQIDRYREQGKFEPWLFRIAMNRLRDEMRRRKRQARPMDMSGGRPGDGEHDGGWGAAQDQVVARIGTDSTDPAQIASTAEQVERLKLAISQLNPADQEILRLRHTAGLSFNEIAQTLEQPLGTVLARGHRALAKLKKLMEDDDETASPDPA